MGEVNYKQKATTNLPSVKRKPQNAKSKTSKVKYNQVTGNAGMYYLSYLLSRRKLNVMPTARNARGVDLIVYDTAGTKSIGIQVKTLSRYSPVPVGNWQDMSLVRYWCIVVLNPEKGSDNQTPCVYVASPEEIKNGIGDSKWLRARQFPVQHAQDSRYSVRFF